MTTTPLPRLNKYGLAAPCADDVRSAVAAVDYLNFTKNWNAICDDAGIGHHANLLDIDQMHALSNALTAAGGSYELIGKSFDVRINAYEEFSKNDDDIDRSIDLGRKTFEGLLKSRPQQPEVLAEINSLGLASPKNKLKFDAASQRAASALRAPIGYVSVIVNSSQLMVGQYGLPQVEAIGGVPIEWSFCATTVRRSEAYVVNDAEKDTTQRFNPVVRFEGVRAYAGVPLITSGGLTVGALCVTDLSSRFFATSDVALLSEIADQLLYELESDSGQIIKLKAS